ncbi:MAG: cupin domain-containing protein [Candidatus Dadabacteria bacterium]|nr:cupin domain-containing protein [Candidatus Dadabacteria bacterium]NIQ13224.1 cupin domain-containing protein [Candidatus Dadabacteria bacterium]
MKILGTTVDVKIKSKESEGMYYVFQLDIPPGEEIPVHFHDSEDEILTLIKGNLELSKDGKVTNLTTGDVANLPRKIPHGLKNNGNDISSSIVVVTPGESFENFFGELSILSEAEEINMDEVISTFSKYGIHIS